MSQVFETKKCPECGRPSLPDREECWKCGADLTNVAPAEVPLRALPPGGPAPQAQEPRRPPRLAVTAVAIGALVLIGWLTAALADAHRTAPKPDAATAAPIAHRPARTAIAAGG
jgi:hypothetical protein